MVRHRRLGYHSPRGDHREIRAGASEALLLDACYRRGYRRYIHQGGSGAAKWRGLLYDANPYGSAARDAMRSWQDLFTLSMKCWQRPATRNLEPSGIGIATAGAVDDRDGSIFAATDNLPGWSGFQLRAFAEDRFQLPVAVVNDAQAAVLSELHFGVGRGLSDFAVITMGTGVGGGIVSAGKLVRGQHGFAGTIGHSVIHSGGLPCNCGRHGCLEAYVSTAALLREYPKSMVDRHGGWHRRRCPCAEDQPACAQRRCCRPSRLYGPGGEPGGRNRQPV